MLYILSIISRQCAELAPILCMGRVLTIMCKGRVSCLSSTPEFFLVFLLSGSLVDADEERVADDDWTSFVDLLATTTTSLLSPPSKDDR